MIISATLLIMGLEYSLALESALFGKLPVLNQAACPDQFQGRNIFLLGHQKVHIYILNYSACPHQLIDYLYYYSTGDHHARQPK